MAHGDFWPTWSGLDREDSPGRQPDRGIQDRANLSLLLYVTALAVMMTSHGFELYDQRCQPPY